MNMTVETTTTDRQTPEAYWRGRADYWRTRGAFWVADFLDGLADDCAAEYVAIDREACPF